MTVIKTIQVFVYPTLLILLCITIWVWQKSYLILTTFWMKSITLLLIFIIMQHDNFFTCFKIQNIIFLAAFFRVILENVSNRFSYFFFHHSKAVKIFYSIAHFTAELTLYFQDFIFILKNCLFAFVIFGIFIINSVKHVLMLG